MSKEKFLKPAFKQHIDPVTFFNENHVETAKEIIASSHGKLSYVEKYYTFKNGYFTFSEHELLKVPIGEKLTPFQILNILRFYGNFTSAVMYIERTYMEKKIPFIRVGVDYFKKIEKKDRYHIERPELKRWTKTEIIQDYGKTLINHVPKYDDFIIEPDNLNYCDVIEGRKGIFYNLYNPFTHKPNEGEWTWTERLLKHIFGDQYELGLRYMQVLYLMPKQILPILVLASKKRGTGKSTFLNWLSQIFGSNMVIINPEDLTGQFNGIYARSNIIAIEETMIDKQTSTEKLKAITTQKEISVNQKHVDNYKIPFFGKVIINTNNENNFVRIDDEEIRFWIRKLPDLDPGNANHLIEDDLKKEIPAFLHYLAQMPEIDRTKSRMIFTPEEIKTEHLELIKDESKPGLYKDMVLLLTDMFFENDISTIEFTAKQFKEYYYNNDSRASVNYISKICKEEFGKVPEMKRATPLHDSLSNEKYGIKTSGMYFTFTVEDIGMTIDEYSNKQIELKTLTSDDDEKAPY